MVTHTTIIRAIISFGLFAAPTVAAPAAVADPVALAAPASIAEPATAAAAAGEYLGGINMDAYCIKEIGPQWRALRFDSTCNGWKCWDAYTNFQTGINTPRACVNQYGAGVYARCNGDALSWGCYKA